MGIIPADILQSFGLDNATDIRKFGTGLIHETFEVKNDNQKYLLQKLNHFVFKNIDGLMNNIDIVSQHIKLNFPNKTFIDFVKPINSNKAYLLWNGEYWRCMPFITNSQSYEKAEDEHQAYEAGKVVGDFHLQVAAIAPGLLIETIPNFHNFEYRYANFQIAIQEDLYSRVLLCKEEIDYLHSIASLVLAEEMKNNLPTRVTHNDTKLNNILFDKEDKGICMVDLDTLMPGNIMFDTGDVLRTMCNPAGEDGRLGKVSFDKEIFIAFVAGYIHQTKGSLSVIELRSIPLSIVRMTCEQAIRFLTDYLQGDVYYKQVFPFFNLICTKGQIDFMKIVTEELDWMQQKVENLLNASTSNSIEITQ